MWARSLEVPSSSCFETYMELQKLHFPLRQVYILVNKDAQSSLQTIQKVFNLAHPCQQAGPGLPKALCSSEADFPVVLSAPREAHWALQVVSPAEASRLFSPTLSLELSCQTEDPPMGPCRWLTWNQQPLRDGSCVQKPLGSSSVSLMQRLLPPEADPETWILFYTVFQKS